MTRSRWRYYIGAVDPDLPAGDHLDRVRDAHHRVTGRRTLDGRTGEWVTTVPALPDACLQAVVRCDAHGCGAPAGWVWATPHGLLYFAHLVQPQTDTEADRAEVRSRQTLMRHPQLGRTAWTTPHALDRVWRKRGWQAAPDDAAPPAERWKPRKAVLVRDLIDADPDDDAHPPLRACCVRRQHGGWVPVDRGRLAQLAGQRRPAGGAPHTLLVSAVLAR